MQPIVIPFKGRAKTNSCNRFLASESQSLETISWTKPFALSTPEIHGRIVGLTFSRENQLEIFKTFADKIFLSCSAQLQSTTLNNAITLH